MGSGMAQIFMPRLFGDLHKILPGVRLEILTAPTKTIFNDLHEERLDAGIAIESDPDRVPAGLRVRPADRGRDGADRAPEASRSPAAASRSTSAGWWPSRSS